jgi:hypothetical protein
LAVALLSSAGAAAAGWQPPQTISEAGLNVACRRWAQPGGHRRRVWLLNVGPRGLQGAVRPAGGAWGAPETLALAPTVDDVEGSSAELAVDPLGNAVVVWTARSSPRGCR